jgi:hypothetical protein
VTIRVDWAEKFTVLFLLTVPPTVNWLTATIDAWALMTRYEVAVRVLLDVKSPATFGTIEGVTLRVDSAESVALTALITVADTVRDEEAESVPVVAMTSVGVTVSVDEAVSAADNACVGFAVSVDDDANAAVAFCMTVAVAVRDEDDDVDDDP